MSAQSDNDVLTILQKGSLKIDGEFLWGSNYTYAIQVTYHQTNLMGVYKPTRGERPLWDFPSSSLAGREVAAYLVSEALGWRFVPPTVYRKDAPMGPGSIQQYIQHDSQYHYFNLTSTDRQRLKPAVLFDLLINNADRKGSHVLFDPSGKMWLIDHGICFHRENKLRTVIWDFAGETIPEDLCFAIVQFRQKLTPGSELEIILRKYLTPEEITAITKRTDSLLRNGHFPEPRPNHRPYPWPPL